MLNIERLAPDEVGPLLREVDGPIDSFKVEEAFKDSAKSRAIQTGSLEGISFQACPLLSNLDQKRIRQESLRGWRIWQNLHESRDEFTPEELAFADSAERVLWQATLVEASRRAYLAEQGVSNDNLDFCRSMVAQSIEELYPQPNMDITAQCINLFRPKFGVLEQSGRDDIKNIASDFLISYPFVQEIAEVEVEKFDPAKEAALKELLLEKYQPLFEQLRSEYPEINNQILPEVTTRFLELAGLAKTGWKIEPTQERNGFYTRPQDKVVECGKRSKEITWPAFERLVVHEIGVHALRSERGYEVGNDLLAIGIGDYSDAEEGIAILFEKIWAGTATKDIVDRDDYRYLVASYASGVMDGKFHGPNETFKFITELNIISLCANSAKKGEDIDLDEIIEKARKTMFEHVYRAFRGMPDGIVLTKDTVYKTGKIKLTRFINNSNFSTQELYDFLTLGKIDPTNEEHVEIRKAILSQE
jgi:hypothetical protein